MSEKLNKPISIYFETTSETKSFDISVDSSKDILNVFVNGFKLIQGLEFTYTNTKLTLTKAIDSQTKVEIVVFKGD